MKILFFDAWTKGIRNFSRLTESLKKEGFDYKLFHLESWDGNSVAKVQEINGIRCFDISHYNTNYIYNVLKDEKPDIVLILSLSYILDRTIVSMCNHCGIKVVYLAHGKIYMKSGVGNLSQSTSILAKTLSRIRSKKMMVLRNYVQFNLLTEFHPFRIIRTFSEFINHSDRTMFTPYCEEFKVDKGMVYYDSEKKMFEDERHFPQGMIEAVGNPEMDSLINTPIKKKDDFLHTIRFIGERYALYMDDGFVQENILSYSEWENFITELIAPLNENKIGLIIKLHPRTDIAPISDFLKNNSILAIKDVDFKNVICHSEFVISHSSSTVLYGMILDKPIILPRWGIMSDLIKNYPESCVNYCDSPDSYRHLVFNGVTVKDNKEYLESNCGKLDGKAVERIVGNITKLKDL